MTITALPSAPLPTDNTATFNSKAFALVAALNTFVTEANATGSAANADAVTAAAKALEAVNAEAAAAGAANYKGAWSGLSGSLAIPASVTHLSKVWILTESVANVTTEVPGTSSKWLAVSVNFDSPGVIGGVTPSVGNFTSLSASGLLTATGGVVVGAGAAPAFSAYGSAAQTLASSTLTKIAYNTILFDTNNNYSTANARFTPTVAGYYLITANFTSGAPTAISPLLISLYKNGSRFADGSYSPAFSGYGGQTNMSYILFLNGSTDYVEIYGFQASGSSLTVGSDQNGQNFSAAMIRSA